VIGGFAKFKLLCNALVSFIIEIPVGIPKLMNFRLILGIPKKVLDICNKSESPLFLTINNYYE